MASYWDSLVNSYYGAPVTEPGPRQPAGFADDLFNKLPLVGKGKEKAPAVNRAAYTPTPDELKKMSMVLSGSYELSPEETEAKNLTVQGAIRSEPMLDENGDKVIDPITGAPQMVEAGDIPTQRRGINRFTESVDKLNSIEPRADLSGLMALTDTWTGSKFANSYTPPMSPEELAKTKAVVEKMLQEAKGDVVGSDVALINALSSGVKGAASQQSMDEKRLQRIRDDIEKEKSVKLLKEGQQLIDKVTGLIARGEKGGKIDLRTAEMISGQMLKFNGLVGSQSDMEGQRALMPTIDQMAGKLQILFGSGGDIKQSEIKPWKDSIASFRSALYKNSRRDLQRSMEQHRAIYPGVFAGGDSSRGYAVYEPYLRQLDEASAPAAPAPAKAAPKKMSAEDLLNQRLKTRKGK